MRNKPTTKIGTKFIFRNGRKNCVEAEVVDIYTVTNNAGEVIDYICMAEYDFLGQMLKFEVPFATVQRNLVQQI